jgi:3-phosphoshikimate 1-carboxyvinyltransferase
VIRMIDEFPAFAVAASYASGHSIVVNAEELRHKESDRISALGSELSRLGVCFSETADGFTIQGGRSVSGGKVESHVDHRLAMSLALMGLFASNPVTVKGAGIIQESFPDFPIVLQKLGAHVEC